ncbi:MAG: 3-deoxy-7-phosphoheptulonate synthase [Lentisphaerae bacterium]|jgi:3-deoxy-7-phosphoheptulonate synthase|nr:3-deoxy-7-phosphoheptulonate synthase [Lentisphaerota bacterium]
MIVVMRQGVGAEQVQAVQNLVTSWGLKPHVSAGAQRTLIGLIGDEAQMNAESLAMLPGVERVMAVHKPYKRVSAEFQPERTVVKIPPVRHGDRGLTIGGPGVVVMAGPCSVESREMLLALGAFLKGAGAHILRGGAFKPRTSPYAFQGLGVEGVRYLVEERSVVGMPVVTEVMDTRDVEMLAEFADVLQVGARNMQNFNLLKALGRCQKPVMLKRGLANTLEELLMSAEYVMSEGNEQVILCERGIRTFEKFTRNTLDLSAVPVLKRESHLPVVVDPSHGVGHWDLVAPMARAAIAAGADGVMIEVHPDPTQAVSDGPQSLTPQRFKELMGSLELVARAVGRNLV